MEQRCPEPPGAQNASPLGTQVEPEEQPQGNAFREPYVAQVGAHHADPHHADPQAGSSRDHAYVRPPDSAQHVLHVRGVLVQHTPPPV